MAESLLDFLSETLHCYISSLPNMPMLVRALSIMRNLETNMFTIKEYNYTLSYLFNSIYELKSQQEIDELIVEKLQALEEDACEINQG